MLKFCKYAVSAAVVTAGLTMAGVSAQAMPALDTHAAATTSTNVEQARWVCGPFRCFWRPNYYGYYGGWHRPWGYGGYGWHRGWHGGWHGGWHRHW